MIVKKEKENVKQKIVYQPKSKRASSLAKSTIRRFEGKGKTI